METPKIQNKGSKLASYGLSLNRLFLIKSWRYYLDNSSITRLDFWGLITQRRDFDFMEKVEPFLL